MPGPIAHHFTARAVAESLSSRGLISSEIINSAAPFLHFGSQGPDFLFFNSRDWPVDASEGVQFFLNIYGTLEEIKQFITDALPIEELNRLLDEGVEESTIIDQVVSTMRGKADLIALAEANIRTGIESFLTHNFASDIFNNVIGHPEQRAHARYQNKQNWWWFDTLHYKRTGRFAQTLLQNAQAGGNNQEIAYALGYLTHYAADTVGHPYINILSGGPYRTHSQRHKVIENYHDTFLYRHYTPGGELPKSHLYTAYLLSGSAAHPQLPSNIANLLMRTMAEVYPDRPVPRYGNLPDEENLQAAYHLWFLWFRKATTVLEGLRPPVLYSFSREFAEALARFEREMREISDLLSSPTRGGFDILSIFEFLAALVMAQFEFFKALFDWIIGSALTIALAPFRSFLNLAYETLYNLFMQMYEMVSLSGLAFPYHNMIYRPQTNHILNPSFADCWGRNANTVPGGFPFKRFWPEDLRNEAHLVYPYPRSFHTSLVEISEVSRTNRGPVEYFNHNPVFYLENAGNTVPTTYQFLSELDDNRLPELLDQNFTLNNTLGSARSFSSFLFNEISEGRNIPDFNLDGDRGYGYKSWRLRESTREAPGTENDFPRINQVEENIDHNVPDSLVDNI